MNKILLSIFFILSLFFSLGANAQPDDRYFLLHHDSKDSNLRILNSGNAKFYNFHTAPIYVFNYKHEVNQFIDSTASAIPIGFDKIDFSQNSLALISYHGGDCHATFSFKTELNNEAKQFIITVTDHYGGCRAGGKFFTNWALIPKLPYDYNVELRSVFAEDFNK